MRVPDEAESRSPLLRALQAMAADGGCPVILETRQDDRKEVFSDLGKVG
jgi:hypothetical protein